MLCPLDSPHDQSQQWSQSWGIHLLPTPDHHWRGSGLRLPITSPTCSWPTCREFPYFQPFCPTEGRQGVLHGLWVMVWSWAPSSVRDRVPQTCKHYSEPAQANTCHRKAKPDHKAPKTGHFLHDNNRRVVSSFGLIFSSRRFLIKAEEWFLPLFLLGKQAGMVFKYTPVFCPLVVLIHSADIQIKTLEFWKKKYQFGFKHGKCCLKAFKVSTPFLWTFWLLVYFIVTMNMVNINGQLNFAQLSIFVEAILMTSWPWIEFWKFYITT